MGRNGIVTWQSVVWHTRAGVLVFLVAAVALVFPPQMKDLLADLAGFSSGSWRQAFAFHIALMLMAFLLWYWTRTVLRAVFRVADTRAARQGLAAGAADGAATVATFDWLPRLLFLGTAIIAAIAAVRSSDWLQAVIALAWGGAGFWKLALRLASGSDSAQAPPMPERAESKSLFLRQWRRLLDLLDGGPFGRWFAAALLAIAGGLFAGSALLGFLPGGIRFSTFPAQWFPGASAALLLFGLAVGPLTALTYVFDRVAVHTTLFGLKLRWPPFPVLLALAALLTFGPYAMNLHAVRIAADPGAMSPDARVSLADYFRQWVKVCAPGSGPVRPVLVSVSGGASRAAVWAARILTLVDHDLANSKDSSVFAVSSVSGGSLGTAAYMAMRAAKPGCRLDDLAGDAAAGRDDALIEALRADAIGPALAGTLLGDVPRDIVGVVAAPIVKFHNDHFVTPWVLRGNDRAEALERAFEANWRRRGIRAMRKIPGVVAPIPFDAPYLSLFYANGALRGFVPAWIANGTDQQKGDRIVTAPFKVNAERFCDDGRWYGSRMDCAPHDTAYSWNVFGPLTAALDALGLLKADIPVSTAITNTARFPFLSPSGELTPAVKSSGNAKQIIDGGYFENEGLETSLEIARWLKTYGPGLIGRPVYPVLVQATADADIAIPASGVQPSDTMLNAERQIARCGNRAPATPDVDTGEPRSVQLLVPVLGLSAVRGGHTHVALREAQQEFCDEGGHQAFFDFYLYNGAGFDVPLNWVLSKGVGVFLWSQDNGALGACWNRAERKNLETVLASTPDDWTANAPREQVYACVAGKMAPVPFRQLSAPAAPGGG
jgi:hypothetical protein